MSTTADPPANERCKAAAWVWHQRGRSCSQQSEALMKPWRRSRTSSYRSTMPSPSRFQREAAAALYDRHLHSTPAPDRISDAAVLRHTPNHQPMPNPIITSCDRSQQSSAAACRNCPAALDHCADCHNQIAPAQRRKSAASPPAHINHWTDKLFGINSRKSFSSSQNSVDSLRSVCSSDHEFESLRSLVDSFWGQMNGNGATVAATAFGSVNSRSSLLDSFELCAVLRKLGYVQPHIDHVLEEQVFTSLEKETRPVSENDHHAFSAPPPPPCKQSLYDLLGWSERGINIQGCSCTDEVEDCSSDYYYQVESPDINMRSCNTKRQRRRRRPSILLPHLSHSFSNALHHMHLPHSFSNALHHLPHSFSNALHHLPQLPHSFSNALHQIAHLTHTISSVYRHLNAGSHHQHADSGHSNDTAPNGHNSENASSPRHHAHAHRHPMIPSSLRHFLSFKSNSSPLHPSCDSAFNSVSPAANCCNSTAPTLVQRPLKSSPTFDQRLSAKSDDYMLIYSSAKKHSSHGIVHHLHHHHHYHHYHYVF